MQLSAKHGYVLIEVPRTGAASVARLLQMSRPDGSTPFMDAEAARKVLGNRWKKLKKIVTVRPVLDRFRSACMALELSYDTALDLMRDTPKAEWPVALRPQSDWLKCAFDVILDNSSIANFANVGQFGRSANRTNETSNPERIKEVHVERLQAFYEEDFKLFETLRCWHPDPSVVQLVTGRCKACEKKLSDEAGPAPAAPSAAVVTIEPSVIPDEAEKVSDAPAE